MNSTLWTWMAASVVAISLVGCNPWSSRCEELCTRLVDECDFGAWSSAEQCRMGCVDDMYRRHDAEELLACYETAIEAPSEDVARQRVLRAQQAGLFDEQVASGTFDETIEVQRAIEFGTCDVFEFVQCKVDAVQVLPETPLLP